MSLTVLGCHAHTRAAGNVALARCFRVVTTTAVTAQTWRFTTAPCNHEVFEEDGAWHTYTPAQVVVRESSKRQAMMGDRLTQIRIGTTGSSFTGDDVKRRFLDAALVYEFLVDWRNQHRPPMQVFRWRVLDWEPGRDSVTMDLGGVVTDLRRDAGDWFAPSCSLEFAGAFCDAAGVIAANADFAFKTFEVGAGTHTRNRLVIRERTSPSVTFPTAARTVANWWAHGILRGASSDNDLVQTIIESNTTPSLSGVYSATFELSVPLPFVPVENDLVTIRVGCDRAAATCKTKFANLDQRRGFHLMPGSDYIRRTPEAT